MDSNIINRRPRQSLPFAFEILLPERGLVTKRNKKYQKRANEALSYITSAFYAKILIILGIALPITDALATNEYGPFDEFYVYLYSGSLLFLLYMYYIQKKNKQKDLRQIYNDGESNSSGNSTNNNNKQQIQYGSFYFRLGVTGFGISSVIYSGLQFGQYFEYESGSDCINYVTTTKLLLKIIFTVAQIFFIFSYTNFANVQKRRIIARFGLMHMIATNLCEWLFIIVEETQHDIFKSALIYTSSKKDRISNNDDSDFINSTAFQVTKEQYERKIKCLATKIMEPILTKTEPYLAPCTVEYSFLCAVILGLMWRKSSGDNLKTEENLNQPTEDLLDMKKTSVCNVIYNRNNSYLSVDCTHSHKGLFGGISVLVLTVISLIMFFELVSKEEYKDFALLQVNIWEAILFVTGTIATIFCMLSLRNVGIRRTKRNLELEHLLLLATQCGVFMYFLFQIIGAALMGLNKGTGGIMRIITPLTALIQSSWQTLLVLDAWRRRCSTDEEMRLKPGRQLVTFLLVANISLWFVNRLKNNRSVSHPNQMDVYGILPWNIITHVSMPLVVSYRFQSSVCFYEIWKKVYKNRHIPLHTSKQEDPS